MKKSSVLLLLAGLCLLAAPYPQTPAGYTAETKEQRDARFGLFIHWGVYSVPAGYYHGKSVGAASGS